MGCYILLQGGSSWPRDRTWVSCIVGKFFTNWDLRESPTIHWWYSLIWNGSRESIKWNRLRKWKDFEHLFFLLSRHMCSVALLFSCSVVSNSATHGLKHARLPCPSPSPGVCSNSCPSSRWCHPTVSSSAIPFSSCLHAFPASESFPVSWLFTSSGQSIGV